jgi:mannose-6-phosphate isomerase-like protein (cupin superfamily)
MKISRFDKATASGGHNDTILASEVLPKGMSAPFGHAWGYLENGGEMEGHTHPTTEIYLVFSGTGTVVVGDERAKVSCGDVIEIPPDIYHTMICDENAALLWAALWWE